jgi:hypothetical protein
MAKKYDKKLVDDLISGAADGPAAAWLAGDGSLEGVDAQVALSAVEAAVKTRNIERLQSLEDDGDKALRKAARAGLHRLRSAGVEVPERREAARFTLAPEAINHWSTAWIGPPDGDGYSQIFLFWADAELQGFYACHGGGGQGIIEENTRLIPSTRSRMRTFIDGFSVDPYMHEVPFTTGLHLCQNALSLFEEITGRVPQDWANFLANVPEGTRNAAQLLNPIAGLTAAVDEAALSRWDQLERTAGHDWPFDTEAMSPVGVELLEFLSSELEVPDDVREARVKEMEVKAAEAGLTDEARKAFTRRLRNLAIYAAAGGEAALAAQAWNHLQALEAGVEVSKMPYFGHVAMSQVYHSFEQMMSAFGGQMGADFLHEGHSHDHGHGHDHSHDHE